MDPALIYHYFGSKEGLLDAATDPPLKWLESVVATWAAPTSDLGRQLVRNMLGSWADEEIGPILRAVMMTAAHDSKTRDKLRAIVERGLIGESTLGADEDERLRRSGRIATQLIGLGMVR